jgi:hypothetical protein
VPPRDSLLTRLQRLIERSYDWNTGIEDLGPYLLGDEGYRRFYEGKEIAEELPGASPGARTLVSWRGPQIRIGVYYPDALVLHLERRNPLHRVDEDNVGPFAVLVEELDHLLMLAWCARHRRGVGLLELEVHANVTKYMVLAHFLARLSHRPHLAPSQRRWVLHRLFHGAGEACRRRSATVTGPRHDSPSGSSPISTPSRGKKGCGPSAAWGGGRGNPRGPVSSRWIRVEN